MIGASQEKDSQRPILILGAGINGVALARELLLNGIPVTLVDCGDIAGGTTAYSSRLIHGGLRYLEYGDFGLVRESLVERDRLLRLAPQFVRPLRFHIPLVSRWGGWLQAAARFLGWSLGGETQPRGMWLVRCGLALYDWYSRASGLPGSRAQRIGHSALKDADARRFKWLCSYSDAQVLFPERLVIAMLQDAEAMATDCDCSFEVLTYHQVEFSQGVATLTSRNGDIRRLSPTVIVNATGAWVDRTLAQLEIDAPKLMGGTKGSHLVVAHPRLADYLGGEAVYLEASDGRPVFLLPFTQDVTLIGTTDIPFDADPGSAVADSDEKGYLLHVANDLFPEAVLSEQHILFHYSGVRPLPRSEPGQVAGAITRGHSLRDHPLAEVPMVSMVGGKLTTCREFAEQAADRILSYLGQPRRGSSRERPVPGGEGFPASKAELDAAIKRTATRCGLTETQAAAIWQLQGNVADDDTAVGGEGVVRDTDIPVGLARAVIEREWVECLGDLVERRLMLLFDRRLSENTLRDLAGLLCEAGKLDSSRVASEVTEYCDYLQYRYGRQVS